ncbi:helix-turn-helix domain-containing protein [Streptomyces sp. NPDC058682]|uniref:helix-turn-helix domain-containing protein n=1 Tax=Streptomyces sp. NPDC058682 TaxID=3346596 RepID=UPI003667F0AE
MPVTLTSGVLPRRDQVRPFPGFRSCPASSSKTIELITSAQDLAERDHRLEVLGGPLSGMYDPQGAGKVLFVVFAAMAEIEREFIHERTLIDLDTAAANGKHGGRPAAIDGDMFAVALRRRDSNESVTAIAQHLGVGRSTLYRTLAAYDEAAATTDERDATDH